MGDPPPHLLRRVLLQILGRVGQRVRDVHVRVVCVLVREGSHRFGVGRHVVPDAVPRRDRLHSVLAEPRMVPLPAVLRHAWDP